MRSPVLAALLAVSPLTALAQQPTLEPGQRIRITFDCTTRTLPSGKVREDCRREAGTFISTEGDSLRWAAEDSLNWAPGDPVRCISRCAQPLVAVSKLERSVRQYRQTGRGASVGAAVGGVLGAIVGVLDCECGGFAPLIGLPLGGVAGIPIGTVIGAMVGYGTRADDWESVPFSELRR